MTEETSIAHEADVNPIRLHEALLPIDRRTADDAVDFIERVGENIYAVIALDAG